MFQLLIKNSKIFRNPCGIDVLRRILPPQLATFHCTPISRGIEEFFDPKKLKPTDVIITGRSWTAADLRRKSFDDLHKLWYVLYKERNLLLTAKEKARRSLRPISAAEEARYMKVKRSMGAMKLVLAERKRISQMLKTQDLQLLPQNYFTKPTTRQKFVMLLNHEGGLGTLLCYRSHHS
eukprot:gene5332-10661_t